MMRFVSTFRFMLATGVKIIVIKKVQNYEKIVFIKNIVENVLVGGCILYIFTPPGSALARL